MRSRSRWSLLALLGVAVLMLAVVWIAGPVGISPGPALNATESEARASEPAAPVLSAPIDASRELAPGVDGSDDDMESWPESEAVSDQGEATLVVTLIGGGKPVGPGVLQLELPSTVAARTCAVDASTGRALFGDLTPGRHSIRLFHLPPGWVPPRTAAQSGVDGPKSVPIEIHRGANTCDIVLEPSARVFGQVLGPNGERLDRARVQFAAYDSAGARTSEPPLVFAVDSGRYEGELHEGVWLAEVAWFAVKKDARGKEAAFAEFPPPPVQVRMIHSGAAVEMDFACERHAGAIEGHVVDETGEPFRGLSVLLNRAESVREPESGARIELYQHTGLAITEDDGSFAFRGLLGGKFVLSIDTGPYLAVTRPGVNAIGEPFAPAEVDVGADGRARAELTVRRSHPVHVHGRFEPGGKLSPSVFLTARLPGGSGTVRWMIDVPGWRFDFYVEAAVVDPAIEVEFQGKRTTYPLTLSAGSEAPPLVLSWPK